LEGVLDLRGNEGVVVVPPAELSSRGAT
jgi:hypothetical protein